MWQWQSCQNTPLFLRRGHLAKVTSFCPCALSPVTWEAEVQAKQCWKKKLKIRRTLHHFLALTPPMATWWARINTCMLQHACIYVFTASHAQEMQRTSCSSGGFNQVGKGFFAANTSALPDVWIPDVMSRSVPVITHSVSFPLLSAGEGTDESRPWKCVLDAHQFT